MGIITRILLGLIITGILLTITFRKDKNTPRTRTATSSLLLCCYLSVTFTEIVGIPTVSEISRMSGLGENIFNPVINFVPFADGLSLSFILNIFLLMPLGFLCPFISRTWEHAGNTVLLGLSLSLLIEVSQLFTLYRATDIDDLLTNTLGAFIGWLCFRLLASLKLVSSPVHTERKHSAAAFLPPAIITVTFILGFLLTRV